MIKQQATRYHDFCYGHTVHEHESKCAHLHGHNGRVTFYCEAPELDSVGRVIDFSVIKSTLCEWLEENWDHRFLVYSADPRAATLQSMDSTVVVVPFNPTAENLARHLLTVVGPEVLKDTPVTLKRVDFEETRKCGVVTILST